MLTAAEVQERLRIKDPHTLYKLFKSGELPFMRVGPGKRAPYRVSEEILTRYLEGQSVKGASGKAAS